MDGSQGGSNSPPPFLTKTYDMVDDPSSNSVVSWSHNNKSFIVWNPPEFSRDLLPKYFKHNNFSSFVRQLNTYGFRKIDPDQWEFANDEFISGQRHLLNNIHRRKPIHSHSLNLQGQGNSSGPLVDAERQELEEKIKRLKRDKGALISELQKHTHQQHGMELQMQSLEDKLQVMEQRQRSMMDFLAQLVQRPGFFSILVEQSDPHTRKRRFPRTGFVYEDADTEENHILSFQPLCRENSDMSHMHTLDLEPFEKMESSLNSLENFFHYVSQASGDDMYCDDPTVHCLPSAVVITEMHASSGETDINLQSPSPKLHPSSTCLEEVHSSPEMAKSTNYAESHALPFMEIQADSRSKVSEIDVNAEPSVCEVSSPRKRATGTPTPSAPAGVNDMFWEQFLTETPGSSEAQEVQSERRDVNEKRSDQKIGEKGNNWWDMRNRRNVDHLTEKMGHLTSAEKT